MTDHLVAIERRNTHTVVPRQVARDGWRVFRSKQTGFELAIPAHQIARVEAIAKRERNEWYALAMGQLYADEAGVHAVVRDFVPNEWAERGRAHVHMGADAEARVRALASELHPGLRPIGNLHTHPRYSTQPSGTDRQEFWRDPRSVSIIVDPFDRPTIAVYRGVEGERMEEVVAISSEAALLERDARPVEPSLAPTPTPDTAPSAFPERKMEALALATLAATVVAAAMTVHALFASTELARLSNALATSYQTYCSAQAGAAPSVTPAPPKPSSDEAALMCSVPAER